MRVILLGRKPAASEVLRRMVSSGVDVVAVVAPHPPHEADTRTFWRPLLRETAADLGVPVVRDDEIYESIETFNRGGNPSIDISEVDLVISFLFWRKILPALVDLPRIGCFNFHPAPLPEFRGRRGYNHAILEGYAEYGASVHWVSDGIDTGDLVNVRRFPIHEDETALSLERRTMAVLLEMFDEFIAEVSSGGSISREPQGAGMSATMRDLLQLMRIDSSDDATLIARKIRAFWYPPHSGATIELGGRSYTLVSDQILQATRRDTPLSREPIVTPRNTRYDQVRRARKAE